MEPGFEKFFSHVHADDLVPLKKGFDHALVNLDSYAVDFRIIDKKGNLKYVSSKQRIFRDQDRPVRLMGFNLDITNRRMADERVSEFISKKYRHWNKWLMGFFNG